MNDDASPEIRPGPAGVPLPVLVPGADSPTGLGLARALRTQHVPIVGLARDPGSPSCRSSVWQEIVPVPEDSASSWLASLAGVAARYGRMALFPACDDVVAVVGEHAESLRGDFDFVASPPEVVRRLLDKTEFHDWAVRYGFPVPHTEVVADPAELRAVLARLRYPAVLKPCERTPAWQAVSPRRKAYVLTSAADVAHIPFDLFAVSPRYVLQEWIPGRDSDVYFCLVYRDRDGHELGSRVGRKIVQWPEGTGNTALCVTVDDQELHDLTAKLFDAAGMVGLGSVEFKRSPVDGRPYITEPTIGRPNLQSGVATAAGTDLIGAAYSDAVGLPHRAGRPADRAAWMHEGTLLRALAVSGWRGRLDVPAALRALCSPSPRGAAFAARGDLTPLGREILRQARVLRRAEGRTEL